MAKKTKKQERPYDGYRRDPVWRQPENYSTYYIFQVDKQCKVPIRNIEEVKTELQQKYGGDQHAEKRGYTESKQRQFVF